MQRGAVCECVGGGARLRLPHYGVLTAQDCTVVSDCYLHILAIFFVKSIDTKLSPQQYKEVKKVWR